MKILLIMTGGTICSRLDGGVLSSDTKYAAPLLINKLRRDSRYDGVEFEVMPVLDILSENMTLPRLWRLLGAFKAKDADKHSYAGIIVAHGTDTLAYTSSLLSLALAGYGKPVFLVSSQYPLVDPAANGFDNFRAAVDMIMLGFGDGVYVTYRNSDGVTYLHQGAHLEQCRSFTSNFYSFDMKPCLNADSCPITSEHAPLFALRGLEECVLKIEPYVGVDYSRYELSGVKAVLCGSYHSSTACVERGTKRQAFTKRSVLYLLRRCKAKNIDFWLTGFDASRLDPDGELNPGAYSTTADLLCSGVRPVLSMTSEAAYMKLILAYSLGFEGDEVEAFMSRQLAGESLIQKGKDL